MDKLFLLWYLAQKMFIPPGKIWRKNQIAPGNSVFLNQCPWILLQMYYLEFSHIICMQGGPARPSTQQGGKRELNCKKFFIVKIKKIDSSSIIKLKTYYYMYIPLQITHNHHPSPTKQNIKIFNKHHPPSAARKNRFTKILSSFKFTLISSIFPAWRHKIISITQAYFFIRN